MKKGTRRWGVALLAGGTLAAAGCREQASGGGGHDATPIHEKFGAGEEQGQEAAPLEPVRESPTGQPTRDSQAGGGMVAPSDGAFRAMGPGAIPQLFVEGLGTSLADSYRGPPEGATATGGAGSAGSTDSGDSVPEEGRK